MALLILHALALHLSSLHETGHVSPSAPEECRWKSGARCSMWQGLATSCRVCAENAILRDEGRCNTDVLEMVWGRGLDEAPAELASLPPARPL